MSGRRIGLVAALAVAVASGCGGDSDQDKANHVAEDYIAALNAKNDSRACELQTASSQNTGGGCTLHSEIQIVPRSSKVGAAEIAGEYARVLVTGPNGSVAPQNRAFMRFAKTIAVQKVVGSSPISRLKKSAPRAGFRVSEGRQDVSAETLFGPSGPSLAQSARPES